MSNTEIEFDREEILAICKNPYYHNKNENKISFINFKNKVFKYFPYLSSDPELEFTTSFNKVAKKCIKYVTENDGGEFVRTNLKRGKIYSNSGIVTKKNDYIARQLYGIDLLEWKEFKSDPKYNRTCYRKEVLKRITIKNTNDFNLIDIDDINKLIDAENLIACEFFGVKLKTPKLKINLHKRDE